MEVTQSVFRKRFTYDPVKDLLGKGGFGEVYKAYDNEDQLFVALKIAQGTTDDKYNLINEIKRFKKLNHPNIVKHIEAYEVNTGGTDIHGNPIIHDVGILEYADQGTFADLLKKGTNYRQIEDIAKDIIDGLAYLHGEGIIHRDLKPTNILLFSEGEKLRAKITDFGIAKRSDATAASTQLVGTVEYMAPEYFTTGKIGTGSDVWSLGVMLLEALTGSHPFGKTTLGVSNEQIIRNILSKDLQENLANAPLKELLTRCLLREVNLRPQSAEELKNVLAEKAENDFAERTVIIGAKPQKAAKANDDEPKWKRILKALFYFNFSKVALAREIFILLLLVPLTILGLFVYCFNTEYLLYHRLSLKEKQIGTLQTLKYFNQTLIKRMNDESLYREGYILTSIDPPVFVEREWFLRDDAVDPYVYIALQPSDFWPKNFWQERWKLERAFRPAYKLKDYVRDFFFYLIPTYYAKFFLLAFSLLYTIRFVGLGIIWAFKTLRNS
jgi:serine/threonine protein kinase